jgi:hypothetical protein
MPALSGLPPAFSSLPGLSFHKPALGPAAQVKQSQAIRGHATSPGDGPAAGEGVIGLTAASRTARSVPRNPEAALDARTDDRDRPAGPTPAFDITPLEQMKARTASLEAQMRETGADGGMPARPGSGIGAPSPAAGQAPPAPKLPPDAYAPPAEAPETPRLNIVH